MSYFHLDLEYYLAEKTKSEVGTRSNLRSFRTASKGINQALLLFALFTIKALNIHTVYQRTHSRVLLKRKANELVYSSLGPKTIWLRQPVCSGSIGSQFELCLSHNGKGVVTFANWHHFLHLCVINPAQPRC